MVTLPSVFGFQVQSSVPLRFLRDGGGEQLLQIVESEGRAERPGVGLVGEWPLHGAAYAAQAALYEVPDGFEYWTTDAGRFRIDLARGRIEIPAEGDDILREQRLHGMPMLLSFAHRGDFSLHAAAVEVSGRAIILAAPSRFGKTTLGLAFHRRGHRLLSEDLVCCRPSTMAVLPGPAVVRLRPDVYRGAPPEGTELVAERPDRVFLTLSPDRRGASSPVPIAGLFFLREAEVVSVNAASAVDNVKDLWHLGYRAPTVDGRSESFRQLTEFAGAVPIWNVERPMRLDALERTVDLIVQQACG